MRVLGLDIGSQSVKGVEFDSALRRFDIREYHEEKVQPGESPYIAAARLLMNLPKPPDKVAVALPPDRATFRNLQLPTKDKKAIQAALGFELEDELPFDLESASYVYTILSQTKQGSSVHVATTLQKHLGEHLGLLAEAGLDPDLLTTHTWAYRTVFNRVLSKNEEERPTLLVHFGARRTTLYLHHQGNPLLTKELAWGGADFTTAIAKNYNIATEEAEQAKIDNAFFLLAHQRAKATPEQAEFSEILQKAFAPILQEVRQTNLTCKKLSQQVIGSIYVSGPTSLMPGLVQTLEGETGIPVSPLRALTAVSTSGVQYAETADSSHLLAAALGLALVLPEKGGIINFRKGDFAKQHRSNLELSSLKAPLTGAGIVLTALFLSLSVQSLVYKSRVKDVDAQLEKAVNSFFGSLGKTALKSYLASPAKLRAKVKEDVDKARAMAMLMGPNPHSPLDFLKQLSSHVKRDVVVDMTSYQVGAAAEKPYESDARTQVALTFTSKNERAPDLLENMLKPLMESLTRSKVEEIKEGAETKWKVTFTGTPKESAYAR